MPRSSGQRLLSFDRKLGARFVAGADEAGRGSLAGPLVVAGVLLAGVAGLASRAHLASLRRATAQLRAEPGAAVPSGTPAGVR